MRNLLFRPVPNPPVGETIVCSPVSKETDWREGVVLENNPALDYVRVKCGPGLNGNPGNIFLVGRASLRPLNDPEGRRKAGLASAAAPMTKPAEPATRPVDPGQQSVTTVRPPAGSNLNVGGLEGIFKRYIAARYLKDGRALDAGHTPPRSPSTASLSAPLGLTRCLFREASWAVPTAPAERPEPRCIRSRPDTPSPTTTPVTTAEPTREPSST